MTNSLKETIEAVRKSFLAALDSFPSDHIEIETLKNNYFGRKGELAKLYAQMGSVAPKDRPDVGKAINALKEECSRLFEDEAKKYISSESTRDDVLDYTLPGEIQRLGSTHPISKTLKEIKDIFTSVGFHITYGPYIVPGRVYRNEAISFKSYCLFNQIEGIVVDKHISFGDLKGTLEYFVKRVFGSSVKMRFRPSFFPFTEPSAEVDIWDEKRGEWLEILGCGMVDPAVFENVGYDPNIWHGYAFGLGIERIAMLKYGISDIRLFFQYDKRFLDQF